MFIMEIFTIFLWWIFITGFVSMLGLTGRINNKIRKNLAKLAWSGVIIFTLILLMGKWTPFVQNPEYDNTFVDEIVTASAFVSGFLSIYIFNKYSKLSKDPNPNSEIDDDVADDPSLNELGFEMRKGRLIGTLIASMFILLWLYILKSADDWGVWGVIAFVSILFPLSLGGSSYLVVKMANKTSSKQQTSGSNKALRKILYFGIIEIIITFIVGWAFTSLPSYSGSILMMMIPSLATIGKTHEKDLVVAFLNPNQSNIDLDNYCGNPKNTKICNVAIKKACKIDSTLDICKDL